MVHLKNNADQQLLCQTALENGVRVYPVAPYFIGPVPKQYQGHVLLGYGSLSPEQIEQGVSLLGRAWL
ncbi:MAG: hypothetical protein ACLUO4_02330 [Christensenellales bacterium]